MSEQAPVVQRTTCVTMAFMVKLALIVEAIKPLAEAKNVSTEHATRLALGAMLPSYTAGGK